MEEQVVDVLRPSFSLGQDPDQLLCTLQQSSSVHVPITRAIWLPFERVCMSPQLQFGLDHTQGMMTSALATTHLIDDSAGPPHPIG